MPRRSNPFQKLSTSLMAIFYGFDYQISESVLVKNNITGAVRELDILVKNLSNPSKNIIIECRDHKRKQNVQWIDELDGKGKRLGFKHIIAVSSSGFTKPASEEAKARDIQTMHLCEAEETDWRKWKFGINKFGFNLEINPIVKDIKLEYPHGYEEYCSENINLAKVYIVDLKKKKKILLKDWITGFQEDPKNLINFPKSEENESIQHFTYSVPCDPHIGFVIEPQDKIIPLVQLTLKVDRIRADYSFSLKHFNLENERMLVGNVNILGKETKIVLYDLGNQLKVMFEQYGSSSSPFLFDTQKGGQLFLNTSEGQIVLDSIKYETQYSQPGILMIQKQDEKKIMLDAKTKGELSSSLNKLRMPFDISSIPDNSIINKAEIICESKNKHNLQINTGTAM